MNLEYKEALEENESHNLTATFYRPDATTLWLLKEMETTARLAALDDAKLFWKEFYQKTCN